MTPADVTAAQGGRALPCSPRPQTPLEPRRQGAALQAGRSPIAGPREGAEHGRAGARKRIGDPRGARAQPRELAQRSRRGDREGAIRRRRGAAADVAERDAGHNAGSALWQRRAQSRHRQRRASDEPRASCRVDRAPPTLSCVCRPYATHVRAVSCAPPCVE